MTISDIAKLSGCGIGTVSRVINNQPGVSEKTREKILKVIAENNYEPNENARQLKMKTASTVCIISKGRSNLLFSDMIEHCMELLSAMEEDTILHTIDEDGDEVEEAIRLVRNQNLKGIIFLGANLSLFDERVDELDIPCVISTTSGESLENKNISSVSVDDEAATEEMIEYLVKKGHRSIVVIGGYLSERQISYKRYQGCKKGFEKYGLEFDESKNYIPCRYSVEAGYEVAKKLLEENTDVTAIFALSDMVAIGVIRAINDVGKKVPDDISVVGFDGIVLADYVTPRITTIQQDSKMIANRSVELLVKHTHYDLDGDHEMIPYKLLERESVREI